MNGEWNWTENFQTSKTAIIYSKCLSALILETPITQKNRFSHCIIYISDLDIVTDEIAAVDTSATRIRDYKINFNEIKDSWRLWASLNVKIIWWLKTHFFFVMETILYYGYFRVRIFYSKKRVNDYYEKMCHNNMNYILF